MKVELTETQLVDCLLNTFAYDDVTGNLIWLNSKYNPNLVGEVAGSIHSTGYRYITWLGKSWKAHRLVYAWHHHCFPEGVIDHIDGNKLNNLVENLRDVSLQENRQNTKKAQSNNHLGVLGVQQRSSGKFRARIRHNKVLYTLGTFSSLQEAICAYKQAKQLLHKGYVHES